LELHGVEDGVAFESDAGRGQGTGWVVKGLLRREEMAALMAMLYWLLVHGNAPVFLPLLLR
jgi:hypothetical protein